MNNNFLPAATAFLISVTPLMLVWVGGVVLAVINWQRAPTSSLLVVLAMLDLGLFRIVSGLVSIVGVPLMREQWGWNHEQVARVFALNGYAATAGAIIGYILLLAAVYIGRKGARPPEAYGQFPAK